MGLKTLLSTAGLALALSSTPVQAENPEFIINPYILTGNSITNNSQALSPIVAPDAFIFKLLVA